MGDLTLRKIAKTFRLIGKDETNYAEVEAGFDGKNRLLVKSETSISTDLSIIQQIDINQSLSNVTYYTVFTDTGVKTVSGFALEFDNRKVFVKLVLDGVTIFDLDIEKLRDILDWNQAALPNFYVSWNDNLKTFYFTPNFPIKSTTDITISVRGKAGVREYIGGIIQVG